jgi:hypothetical protein
MTLDEFRALPTIASQFPLVFETGARWETMSGRCTKCGEPITGEALRGHVTRPFGRNFLMDAWGLCSSCETISTFRYRLLPDMTMVGRSPDGGAWSVWGPRRRLPWWRRLFAWF